MSTMSSWIHGQSFRKKRVWARRLLSVPLWRRNFWETHIWAWMAVHSKRPQILSTYPGISSIFKESKPTNVFLSDTYILNLREWNWKLSLRVTDEWIGGHELRTAWLYKPHSRTIAKDSFLAKPIRIMRKKEYRAIVINSTTTGTKSVARYTRTQPHLQPAFISRYLLDEYEWVDGVLLHAVTVPRQPGKASQIVSISLCPSFCTHTTRRCGPKWLLQRSDVYIPQVFL